MPREVDFLQSKNNDCYEEHSAVPVYHHVTPQQNIPVGSAVERPVVLVKSHECWRRVVAYWGSSD